MNQVILHGPLLERFGALPPINVRDPAEALRALNCQLPGFQSTLRKGDWYVVLEDQHGKYAIGHDVLTLGMKDTRMHIIPAIEGHASAKGKGTAKLVIGVALVGASLFLPGATGIGLSAMKTAWATKIGVAGVTYGHLALAGISLAFAGAAMMIAPQPSMPNQDDADQKNSFIFGGANNPSGQGFAVPCVWGRMRVGAIPVATRIETNQIGINSNIAGGSAFTNYPTGYDGSGSAGDAEAWMQNRIEGL